MMGDLSVNGARLYFEVAGTGHPLVLIHAGIADCRMWDEQFALFAQRYRVIRNDTPAAGRLAEIGAPSLIILGDLDESGVLAAGELLERSIPIARKVVMAGTAHLPNPSRNSSSTTHGGN